MKYTKKALTYEKQAQQLLDRGLIAKKNELIHILKSVNYYRLCGYLFPFKIENSEAFKKGTTLEQIWNIYCFDRQFRLIILDGIERIEVALKTDIAYKFSLRYGPFGYLNERNLNGLYNHQFERLLKKMQMEKERSNTQFVHHFDEKYSESNEYLPLWMAVEIMSFGSLLTFSKGLVPSLKQEISSKYNVHDTILSSWTETLYNIRNACAHHNRLWNKTLGYKPKIPIKQQKWEGIDNKKMFSIIVIIKYMLNIIRPESKWFERVENLIKEYPTIKLNEMGFPSNWKNNSILKNRKNI